MNPDRIAMNQRDRDTLTALRPVLSGQRTQAEAARLLGISGRQVRRLVARLCDRGDAGLIHRLRGRPSNRRADPQLRKNALMFYREHLNGFGPSLAAETLAERGIAVDAETLRRWPVDAGLWRPAARRPTHRSRRPRRACVGELVQLDASTHDWTEGRGDAMVLLAMIDGATSRVLARFAPAETTEGYFDLLERWLHAHGRPPALYSDKESVFRVNGVPPDGTDPPTQFGRACAALDIALIFAHSPQAKGRIERFFGTAQDRWVKQMRIAEVTTLAQANALVGRVLQPQFNRRFTVGADASDAHRPWRRREHDLEAILCPHASRRVSSDYVVRFEGRLLQLAKPALPGLRGGTVTVEARRDGTPAIRFKNKYIKFNEIFAMPEPAGRSGGPPRSPAVPSYRPAANHPWRKAFQALEDK